MRQLLGIVVKWTIWRVSALKPKFCDRSRSYPKYFTKNERSKKGTLMLCAQVGRTFTSTDYPLHGNCAWDTIWKAFNRTSTGLIQHPRPPPPEPVAPLRCPGDKDNAPTASAAAPPPHRSRRTHHWDMGLGTTVVLTVAVGSGFIWKHFVELQ